MHNRRTERLSVNRQYLPLTSGKLRPPSSYHGISRIPGFVRRRIGNYNSFGRKTTKNNIPKNPRADTPSKPCTQSIIMLQNHLLRSTAEGLPASPTMAATTSQCSARRLPPSGLPPELLRAGGSVCAAAQSAVQASDGHVEPDSALPPGQTA